MPSRTPISIYSQLLKLLRQHSKYKDVRHLKALAWMINALICSGTINLSAWEGYVSSKAKQAQSTERRWQRFLNNSRIKVRSLYVPLVMAAIGNWQSGRLYLALDTTMLWNRYCMIHLSVVCCGRAIPLLWKVLEHQSATVAFFEYKSILRLAHRLFLDRQEIMILADRGFANRELVNWLKKSRWHYCLRLPSDTKVSGLRRHTIEIKYCWPPKGEALLAHNLGFWSEGKYQSNLVLANVRGVKEAWAVITDETPSLETLWQYGLRFSVEELFLDSKSGAFEFCESKIRNPQSLERLYLVVALAILFATTQGMAVSIKGLRRQVDPHWKRGLSYLKIGLRWLKGVIHKGRELFSPICLFQKDPQPCFASKKARDKYYDRIWFSRVNELKYRTSTSP